LYPSKFHKVQLVFNLPSEKWRDLFFKFENVFFIHKIQF